MTCLSFGTLLIAGCGVEKNQDELEQILRDGDLTSMSARALVLAAGGAGGSAGAGGGATAGAGGNAGAPGTGGKAGAPGSGGSNMGGRPGTGGIGVAGSPGSGGGFSDGGVSTGGSNPMPGTGGKGDVDGGVGGFGGDPGIPFPQAAQALWPFDDCNGSRTELFDSLNQGHTAFRSVSTACVVGMSQGGLGIDGADDFVYVPDQPNFTFAGGVTAAAWVKPTKLGDVRTIFRKREGGSSTFVLAENGKEYQFVIRLNDGRAASVSAKAKLNTWTHVAATYNGSELVLYLDGVRAARKYIAGQLSEGAGPLLIGNDAFGRRIDGSLDNVFFDTAPATADQVAMLACVPGTSTMIATPAAGPRVPAGTRVDYDVQITNHDSSVCAPKAYQFNAFTDSSELFLTPNFTFTDPVAPGQTIHIAMSAASTPTADPDTFTISLNASSQTPEFSSFDDTFASVTYSVDGGPCAVRKGQELMIRDVSVVEDPVRTVPGGAWTFGRLMENLAPSAAAAPDMVEATLKTWLSDQTVNGFAIPARPAMQDLVLSTFPRRSDGKLDLGRAPVRLLSIVNRVDLRDLANHNAGEGRFVFGVLDPNGNQTQFTMIFEFKLPANTEADVLDWANKWHALGQMPFPSPQYNAALQVLTDRFSGRNAVPGALNGSALSQFRTNEIALSFIWQFREFHLSPTTGLLEPATIALTPDLSFNFSSTLGDFVNANETAILAEQHTVPLSFNGAPFLTGSVTNDLSGWDPAGVRNVEARHKFSVNTCNGCHSSRETNTGFLQVNPREPGQQAFLSGFLTGTTVFDFRDGVVRTFNDLRRRSRDLHVLVCPDDPLPPLPDPNMGTGGGFGGRSGGGTGGVKGGSGGVGGGMGSPGGTGGFGGTTGGFAGANGGGGSSGTSGGMGGGSTGGGSTGGAPLGGGGTPGKSIVTSSSSTGVAGTSGATTVIDESLADTSRPDFISKGSGRVH